MRDIGATAIEEMLNGYGFTNPANLAVTFCGQPRMYGWTNSLSF